MKKLCLLIFFLRFSTFIHAQVFFSQAGGIYKNSFSLSLSCSIPDAQIYYTTDGAIPSLNSFQYSIPLVLNKNLYTQENICQIQISPPSHYKPPNVNRLKKAIVIRAIAFDHFGNQISEVETNSYFIKELGIEHNDISVISICAESFDLFDDETGIFVPGIHWDDDNSDWTGNYFQRGKNWEKKIHIEFYESDGNRGFKQNAGLRTHGGNARRNPQKGMRLYARSEYGSSIFNHQIFKNKLITSFKRLVLKPFSCSWTESGIEGSITNSMATNLNVDAIGTRPTIVYLNGEYWGIYFLEERVDERYIANNFSVDKDDVDLIENWWGSASSGSNQNFISLYDFIKQNDLTDDSNYQTVVDWIDMYNFIDYQIFEIFIANRDWPANNMKCWREQKEDAKWRWIFFDGDGALDSLDFDSYENALHTGNESWPTNARSTFFLRKLLSNETFQIKFFNRMEELFEDQFDYSITGRIHNAIVSKISNEILDQSERFDFPKHYDKWSEEVFLCSRFLNLRPCRLKIMTMNKYKKSLPADCLIENISITKFSIFPNPNNGFFTLELSSSASLPIEIQISNVIGQHFSIKNEVLFEGQNSIQINQYDLPEGILFVNVICENRIFGTKMICVK